MKLTDFEAQTFDCYGTLIDRDGGMVTALQPLVSKVARPHADEGFGAMMNPGAMPHDDVCFTSLGDFAAAVKAEAGRA